jgi:hypothetical protein
MDQERLNDAMQKEEPAECRKAKPFWKNYRGIALLVAFVLLFTAIGGYTVAYLQMKAKKDVRNDFRLAEVAVSEFYTEREDGATNGKNDVYFKCKIVRITIQTSKPCYMLTISKPHLTNQNNFVNNRKLLSHQTKNRSNNNTK